MKVKAITVNELLEMIPETLYRALTDELLVDKWVPKMKATYLFKLLVFSLLQTKDLSLRVLEEFSRHPVLLGLAPDLFEPVSYGAMRANLYKKRWEIEVFCKFLKQEMNLTHILCRDENAIKVHHLLHVNGIKAGFGIQTGKPDQEFHA